MFATVSTPDKRKRTREEVDDEGDISRLQQEHRAVHLFKKSRPTIEPVAFHNSWDAYGSVFNSSPKANIRNRRRSNGRAGYANGSEAVLDSDDDEHDELSSLVSEPGSPQDFSMTSDEDDDEEAMDDFQPDGYLPSSRRSHPWGLRQRTPASTQQRIPTPMVRNASFSSRQQGPRQHIRRRHPQEISSSGVSAADVAAAGLGGGEMPSPIDEDEVATPPPPPATDMFSQLSVHDVDMDVTDAARAGGAGGILTSSPPLPPTRPTDAMDDEDDNDGLLVPEQLIVRKQRQRSGAMSTTESPVRGAVLGAASMLNGNTAPSIPAWSAAAIRGPPPLPTASRRGFSMGFRADCEKCRLRVPGHMNHFLG